MSLVIQDRFERGLILLISLLNVITERRMVLQRTVLQRTATLIFLPLSAFSFCSCLSVCPSLSLFSLFASPYPSPDLTLPISFSLHLPILLSRSPALFLSPALLSLCLFLALSICYSLCCLSLSLNRGGYFA